MLRILDRSAGRICWAMLLIVLASSRYAEATDVGMWDRFEAAVSNTKSYADPLRDVTLNATYTRPDGSIISFWGFYDGGATWRIRFMPDAIGTWHYEAKFSDGSPGVSGSFNCVASTIPGMISADKDNPRWFGFKGGKHALLRGFHGGPPLFATNFGAAERKTFLDWAQQQGYNLLSVNEFDTKGGAWALPKRWPINPDNYRNFEKTLNDLSARRMIYYAFGGLFAQDKAYPTNAADQTLYIRYYLARFGPYWNIMMNLSGFEANNLFSSADINRLGAEFSANDVFGRLVSVHQTDGDDLYRSTAWSRYATLQHEITSLTSLHAYLLKNHAGKPVLAQETIWLGNNLQPAWTLEALRKHTWTHMMAATTLVVGDMAGNNASGFSGSLNLADKIQARHDVPKAIWDFLDTLPLYKMNPAQNLVSSGFALAETGQRYLVYLPTGGTVNVAVEPGTYQVTWVNAIDPRQLTQAGTTTTGQNLTAPSTADWVLHLVRSGVSAAPVLKFSADADTYIYGTNPNVNYGSAATVAVGGGTLPRQIFMRFNVSGLPQGAVVTDAQLDVYCENTGKNSGGTVRKFAPANPLWNQMEPTWNNPLQGSDASGDLFTLGPVTAGNAYTIKNLASAITGNSPVTFVVRSTYEDGAAYYSREHTNTAQRPVLRVSYTVSANTAPVISSAATASPNPAQPRETVRLTASASDADGDALSYSWNFGDGTTSSGSSVTHAYQSAGSYVAKATVSDGKGGTTSTSVTVVVQNSNTGGGLIARINFQPASTPVPAGCLADNGAVYGNRGNGLAYGWSADVAATARERNSPGSPDKIHDTLIHMQKTASTFWEIAVPNGAYTVRLIAGDPSFTDSIHKIAVEGVLAIDFDPTSTVRWAEATRSVNVADGKLTLSNAAGASNNKICFIEISSAAAVQSRLLTSDLVFQPMDVVALKANMNYSKRNADSLSVKINIAEAELGAEFLTEGKDLSIDVGAAIATFTLNKKGVGRSSLGSCQLKYNPVRKSWGVSVTLKRGSWAGTWADGGIEAARESGEVEIPVLLKIADQVFGGKGSATYTGRKQTHGILR